MILVHYELDLRRAGEAEIRQMALRMARQTETETNRIFEGVENLLSALAHVPAVAEGEGKGKGEGKGEGTCSAVRRIMIGSRSKRPT